MPSYGGSSPSSDMLPDASRGVTVGKYELLTQLNSGGMAELFLGFTPGPGGFRKYVVIKRILPEARDNDQFVKMFLDEARITAAFNHPNIAQVFDLGDDKDGLYLAMEFIGGQNLNQVTNGCARARAVMPLGFSASVVHDCALALHYAHTFRDPAGKDYPVIHRDVAQKNIMVAYDGLVKLLDFGIAKARGTLGKTHAGAVKGTAGYMAPEQVRGEPLDGRADVFSLGVVLYEMITGRRLFSAETEIEEMRMILEAPIPRPSEVLEVIPEELSDVAMRALARDKPDRFASAKEMARALASSCGHLLFDQEQRATFMRELFEDKMAATAKLLESAGAELDRAALLEQAAQAIREDVQSVPTQQVSKKMVKPNLGAPAKKKAKKLGPKRVTDEVAEAKPKATSLADSAAAMEREKANQPPPAPEPPKKEGGGAIITLLLFTALGLGGYAAYRIVFDQEAQPTPEAYKSDVPVPEYNAGPAQPIQGQAETNTEPSDKEKEKEAAAGKEKSSGKEKDSSGTKEKGPAGKGTLTLFTIPGGAKVMLKGKELGKTPLLNTPVPAGTQLLVVVFPDGKRKKLSVPVEPNKLAKFKFKQEDMQDE